MAVIRCDTASWLAGHVLIGDAGFGVNGSTIPSAGIDGAGYAYNDLSLQADAGKEICGRITAWPAAGLLYAYEDTSFTFTDTDGVSAAPDGVYSFTYQLYVDGVATGSAATVTLLVGGVSAGVGNAVAAGATATVTGVNTDVSVSAGVGDAVAAGATASLEQTIAATLNSADIAAIWAYVIDYDAYGNPITAADGMRILLSFAAGGLSGGPGSPQVMALDGTKVRIAGTADENGNRTVTTLDGSA
jgi:hypothetical protein